MVRPAIRHLLLSLGLLGLMFTQPAASTAGGQADVFWSATSAGDSPRLPKGYDPPASLGPLVSLLAPAVVHLACTQGCPPEAGRGPFWGAYGQTLSHENPQGIHPRPLGSGFIISPEGFVVTNAHVVAGAARIQAQLADGRSLVAEVVGADPVSDVALLKIQSAGRLPSCVLGDSEPVQVGDWVIALGNPFGLSHAVSAGLVSAGPRQVGFGPYDAFMQIDAAINPGNSGGPLFDSRGVVVGITTAAGGVGGVGFAVPIDLVKQVLPQLKEHGRVRRGWLGVGIQDLTESLADQFGGADLGGVLVAQVYPDSPAKRAGLEAGDVLISMDGKPVTGARALTGRIGGLPPGARIRLQVRRSGAIRTFKVRLAPRAPTEPAAPAVSDPGGHAGRLGLDLIGLSPERARRLGYPEDLRGLSVTGVDPRGPTAGVLETGDLILEVNRVAVFDLAGFLRVAGDGDRVLLRVQRGQAQVYVVIRASRSGSGSGAR